jgi:hypothetical protein
MSGWEGAPIPPSRLQALLRDDAGKRTYSLGKTQRPPRGLARAFEDYLRAPLGTRVNSVEEVLAFLAGCRYAKDRDVHGREELWLHPEDFERLRVGDCEDHALWAWVQCVRLGLSARFMVGYHKEGGHAWVTLHYRDGSVVVLESTAGRPGAFLIASADAVRYEPLWSVDGELRFRWHG